MVDSLVLKELSEGDKELLNASLIKFHRAKDDTTKINALNNICENMMHDDWSKYQFFQLDLVIKMLKKELDSKSKWSLMNSYSGGLVNTGIIYENKGNIALAVEFFHKGLKIQEFNKDSIGIATTLNNLGSIYYNQGDISLSLKFYHQSLKIKESIGDIKGSAFTLNNLGNIYYKQGSSSHI